MISDNRYGLYNNEIVSIFITHQLRIKSSVGKWTEKLLQKRNYSFINKFRTCWIPDHPGKQNLAGDLSHPEIYPLIPVQYIGPLTRFEKKPVKERKNYLLVVLSGPEPQRSIFEDKIVEEISGIRKRAQEFEENPELVRNIVAEGGEKARDAARATLDDVRRAMHLRVD